MARCVHAARDGTSLSPAGTARAPGSGAGSGPGRCGHAGDLRGWHGGPLSTAAACRPPRQRYAAPCSAPGAASRADACALRPRGAGTPRAPRTPWAPHAELEERRAWSLGKSGRGRSRDTPPTEEAESSHGSAGQGDPGEACG